MYVMAAIIKLLRCTVFILFCGNALNTQYGCNYSRWLTEAQSFMDKFISVCMGFCVIFGSSEKDLFAHKLFEFFQRIQLR